MFAHKFRSVIKVMAAAGLFTMFLAVYAIADLFQVVQVLTLAQISTIFGEDNRLDVYQVRNPFVRNLANSTVGLFVSRYVEMNNETGRAKLRLRDYSKAEELCEEEPFEDQPMGPFCSGTLVGPDIILTAGHCIETEQECRDTSFVFGFSIKKENEIPTSVPIGDVYKCERIIKRNYDSQHGDWALIKLDTLVSGRKPLKLNPSKMPIRKGTPLIVVGHPKGLPTKISGKAKVIDPGLGREFFSSTLDTFSGNSGSAVFNACTLLIEGIHSFGDWRHFRYKGNCKISRRAKGVYKQQDFSYKAPEDFPSKAERPKVTEDGPSIASSEMKASLIYPALRAALRDKGDEDADDEEIRSLEFPRHIETPED
ncbi:trypsin-like serine peptidase [Elusimicrobiota bacterium]